MKAFLWVSGIAFAIIGGWVLYAPYYGRQTGEEMFGKGPPSVEAAAKPQPIAATPAAAEPPKPATPERPPAEAPKCRLTMPGSSDDVLVFPTDKGLDEFASAAASGDGQAKVVAARSNGAFFVNGGTACTWLDVGIATTKIRIIEGARMGAAGYVPTEWAMGK